MTDERQQPPSLEQVDRPTTTPSRATRRDAVKVGAAVVGGLVAASYVKPSLTKLGVPAALAWSGTDGGKKTPLNDALLTPPRLLTGEKKTPLTNPMATPLRLPATGGIPVSPAVLGIDGSVLILAGIGIRRALQRLPPSNL